MIAQELTAQMSESEGVEFFESNIRPVLVRECYGCHSNQTGQAKGGLKLDTKQSMLLGGDSGPSLVPGDLEESTLWSAINYEDYAMPPNKALPSNVIEDFRIWIESGAPDPRTGDSKLAIRGTVTDEDIKRGKKEFWAFQHPRKSEPPRSARSDWASKPVDQFVLAKLEENHLLPAEDADPHTLLRRLCFDLTGLPPNPEQVSWFLEKWESDPDNAVSHVVDRLLESPRFGERWGRHWLDLARFAESSGKELNSTFPHAWRYRDYVIDSVNEDKPYDHFIREQIAGDLLPTKRDREWTEHLVATGFLAIGPKTLTEQNPRQFRADLIDEQIDVATRVILGISVACARCHDHKFDPIPQSDYYAMAGIFGNTDTYYGTLDIRQNRRSSDLLLMPVSQNLSFNKSLETDDLEKLTDELARVSQEYRELGRLRREARQSKEPSANFQKTQRAFAQAGNRMAGLKAVVDSYEPDGTPKSFCMGVQSNDKPADANLLVRGEVDQPAQKVPRGFVQVIGGKKPKIRSSSSGRLELARWMTDESNPLTARVMVNRIWQHLMGSGLVETTENFGSTGLPPTHPALLDYLAVQFMENDWSIKSMIREIANSRAYRMSSQFNAVAYESDPDNKLLWRASPRRLEAEAIRDAMLDISGKLVLQRPEGSDVARGGSSVVRNGQLANTADLLGQLKSSISMGEQGKASRRRPGMANRRTRNRFSNRDKGPSTDPRAFYRSVYLPVVRDSSPRSLSVFDFAEATMVVGRRETSNTPDQGLYFLNNPMVMELSREFAKQLMEFSDDSMEQVQRAFLIAYGRPATTSELQAAEIFLDDLNVKGSNRQKKMETLTYLCQSIMAAAEFRIVN